MQILTQKKTLLHINPRLCRTQTN